MEPDGSESCWELTCPHPSRLITEIIMGNGLHLLEGKTWGRDRSCHRRFNVVDELCQSKIYN